MMNKLAKVSLEILNNPKKFNYYKRKGFEKLMSALSRQETLNIQKNNLENNFSKEINNLIIFLVPGWDGVNGGVMSICSIASVTKEYKEIHGSEVLIATVPKHQPFANYTKFKTSFDIFNFELLINYFNKIDKLILHIPENFVIDFIKNISTEEATILKAVKNLQINIMNQNIWYMPEPKYIDILRETYTENITITVAHKKYCTKQLRDNFSVPVHLFSTSNLTNYYYKQYEKKEDILLTSIDEHPLKDQIISKIKKEIPSLKVKQIENMTYEEYKQWISRAKWMITFGEGIDGYFCESLRSGAIPFAVFNAEFFSETYEGLPNIYESYSEMLNLITQDIKRLDDPDSYKKFNDHLIYLDSIEYDDNEYKKNIKDYYLGEYTLPHVGKRQLEKDRKERVKNSPLVSIVMAVYNGESYLKEQLDSIANLTYKNIELIISDDNSTDNTVKIIKEFQKKYPLKFIVNNGKKGVNGNFENGLKFAEGEFIALCDQDDVWLPNKIEILLENIDDYDIIHSTVELIGQDGKPHPNKNLVLEYQQDHTSKTNFIDFIEAGWMLGCTSLIRRELIQKGMPFPEGIFLHDWWLVCLAIKEGNGIKFVNTPTIKYRQHSSNTAQSIFADTNWYEKKVIFNKTLAKKFENSLLTNEKIALRNNTNYCMAKYFLINDSLGKYNIVDKFLDNNQDLYNRHFFNKFVEIVVEDTLLSFGINNSGNNKFKYFMVRLMKSKVKQPKTKIDKLLSKLYFGIGKPLIVTPIRNIRKVK